MKRKKKLLIAIIAVVLGSGFGNPEQSVGARSCKNSTDFWGRLIKYTGQKKEYVIENLSISNIVAPIIVYEAPTPDAVDAHSGLLKRDPKKGTKIKLSLHAIEKIAVPSPDLIRRYQKEKGSHDEYVEIAVTTAGNPTPTTYLISNNLRVMGDEKSFSSPVAMEIPLNEVKELTIYKKSPCAPLPQESSCPRSGEHDTKAVA